MKIIFLPSTVADIRWFTRYYKHVFPQGSRRANAQMRRTLVALRDNPRIGRPIPDTTHRRFPVLNTPFSLIYRIGDNRIDILRVVDGRANPDRP